MGWKIAQHRQEHRGIAMTNNLLFMCLSISLSLVIAVPLSAMEIGNMDLQIIPKEIKQGDAILLVLSCPGPSRSIRGEWREKKFFFYRAKGKNVFSSLIGIDLDEAPGEKTILLHIDGIKGNTSQMPVRFTVSKKDFPVQRLTLPSKMVFLSPENLARVKREKRMIDRLWDLSAIEKKWKGAFIVPVRGTVLSPFGVRRIINKAPRSPHSGIDLRAQAGTPIVASSDGVVAMTAELFFAGKAVFLDHGMGIITMYFHMSDIHVKKGERVARGQVLGLVGQTGRASGPHLHWGVRIHGNRIDPLSLLQLFKGN
jgi:murein DD-endopeptidase MepM/ murein hydrolase activator NlpD